MPMSPEHGEERQEYYREGAAAQKAGEPRSSVPYAPETLPHDDWQDGYSAALVGTDEWPPEGAA